MRARRRLIQELAEDEGLGKQRLFAAGADVSPSLISRQWTNQNWLAEISGDNLAKLCAAYPAVADYVGSQRELALIDNIQSLSTIGVEVDAGSLRTLLSEGAEPAYVSSVLRVAGKLIRAESDIELEKCVPDMAVFWERRRGRCFEAALTTDPTRRLIHEPVVIKKAQRLLGLLTEASPSRGPMLTEDRARQVLVHYLRLHGDSMQEVEAATSGRNRALDHRCEVTAQLIRDNDHDAAERYAHLVDTSPYPRVIEEWMFPAWTGDIPSSNAPLGRLHVRLAHTGEELLHEIRSPQYPSAYIWYLTTVYLPIGLDVDPTIGGRKDDIRAALHARLEQDDLAQATKAAIADIDPRFD